MRECLKQYICNEYPRCSSAYVIFGYLPKHTSFLVQDSGTLAWTVYIRARYILRRRTVVNERGEEEAMTRPLKEPLLLSEERRGKV